MSVGSLTGVVTDKSLNGCGRGRSCDWILTGMKNMGL